MKRINRQAALVLSLIALLMMSVGASTAIAKPEPPPEGTHLKGPALLGKVTLDGANIAFGEGVCKGQEQADPIPQPFDYNLDDITSAQDIVGFYIEGGTQIFPDCFDFPGGIIVQAAHNLKRIDPGDGHMFQIDVVILGVVPK
jgi:hypothetical protein